MNLQLFFHKFFSNKLALKDSELKKKKKREDEMAESGDEEAESDMDEDEVWKVSFSITGRIGLRIGLIFLGYAGQYARS